MSIKQVVTFDFDYFRLSDKCQKWLARLIRPWRIRNQKVAADSSGNSMRKLNIFNTLDLSPLSGTNVYIYSLQNQKIELDNVITTKLPLSMSET